VSARVLISCRLAPDFTTSFSNVCFNMLLSVLPLVRLAAGLAAYELAHPEQGKV
jgi:hypothetical protein